MGFNNLIKFWGKSGGSCSAEETILAAREILSLIVLGLTPKENVFRLKAYGPISLPAIKSDIPLEKRLQERFKNKCGVDISWEKHLVIYVPRQILGSAAYVAFEKSS